VEGGGWRVKDGTTRQLPCAAASIPVNILRLTLTERISGTLSGLRKALEKRL
jgi:hypothetical protein